MKWLLQKQKEQDLLWRGTTIGDNVGSKKIITYDGSWVEKSFITVSDKPSIGVEINEEGMKKYAIPNVPFFV